MLDALRCRQDDPSWLGWRLPIVAETGELPSPALYGQDVLQFAEKCLTLTGLKRSPEPRMCQCRCRELLSSALKTGQTVPRRSVDMLEACL